MKKIAVAALVLFASGCAIFPDEPMEETKTANDYPTLVKQAKASIKQAASMGGEWRDSKKFLKKADKAAKNGKMEKAIMLAKKAKAEGDLGQEQAMDQKNAGPWLF